MISILNRNGAEFGNAERKVLFDLSIDRIVGYFRQDERKTDKFLGNLCRPLLKAEDIVYRQEVISDFITQNGLFSGLSEYFARFSEMKKDYEQSKKEKLRNSVNAAVSDDIPLNISLLQADAFALKRLLILVRTIHSYISGFEIISEALKSLKCSLGVISDSPEYKNMLSLCSEFEKLNSHSSLNFLLTTDEYGEITGSRLITEDSVRISETSVKKKKGLFSKEEKEYYPLSEYIRANTTAYRKTFSEAFRELSQLIEGYIVQILGNYSEIAGELNFYEMALRYCNILRSRKTKFVFPVFHENGETEISGLRDLLLLLERSDSTEVVSNDFSLSPTKSGTVIFGDNGSGKTVYLRSVAVCAVFAQSGLPVAADAVTLPCFSSFFTVFSESENRDQALDMGRFEKEVSEISVVISQVSENSFVFLNEVFQSTNYSEGAEALSGILHHLSCIGVRWICVTHMKDVLHHLGDSVEYLTASENFKIIKFKFEN